MISTTANDDMNGDCTIEPSSPRSNAFDGRISSETRAAVTTREIPAQIMPFFSSGEILRFSSESPATTPSPSHLPRRGSMMYWLTSEPTTVSKNVETMMNQERRVGKGCRARRRQKNRRDKKNV